MCLFFSSIGTRERRLLFQQSGPETTPGNSPETANGPEKIQGIDALVGGVRQATDRVADDQRRQAEQAKNSADKLQKDAKANQAPGAPSAAPNSAAETSHPPAKLVPSNAPDSNPSEFLKTMQPHLNVVLPPEGDPKREMALAKLQRLGVDVDISQLKTPPYTFVEHKGTRNERGMNALMGQIKYFGALIAQIRDAFKGKKSDTVTASATNTPNAAANRPTDAPAAPDAKGLKERALTAGKNTPLAYRVSKEGDCNVLRGGLITARAEEANLIGDKAKVSAKVANLEKNLKDATDATRPGIETSLAAARLELTTSTEALTRKQSEITTKEADLKKAEVEMKAAEALDKQLTESRRVLQNDVAETARLITTVNGMPPLAQGKWKALFESLAIDPDSSFEVRLKKPNAIDALSRLSERFGGGRTREEIGVAVEDGQSVITDAAKMRAVFQKVKDGLPKAGQAYPEEMSNVPAAA